MTRTGWVACGLGAALVLSNAAWYIHISDYVWLAGPYKENCKLDNERAAFAMALLPLASRGGATREKLLRDLPYMEARYTEELPGGPVWAELHRRAEPRNVTVDKSGAVWDGMLGLEFDDNGLISRVGRPRDFCC